MPNGLFSFDSEAIPFGGTGDSTASNLIDAMNHDAAYLTHVTRRRVLAEAGTPQGASLADRASGHFDAPYQGCWLALVLVACSGHARRMLRASVIDADLDTVSI
jgi:hypothetical protein